MSGAGPVLAVLVVGFHHKKGCQVEFSHPQIKDDNGGRSLPEEWQHLPYLALPDGAHNYLEDCVYFHLPPRDGDRGIVYGVSCYQQMDSEALKVRDSEVTRGTVQKSVCVLSRLPLYGLLQAKLQMITQVYFQEKDFSKTDVLKELYEQLNSTLGTNHLEPSHLYIGLSVRELLLHFGHKALMLFKLILLEKRVLFFIAPVHTLVGTIMALLSLFPGMIERGFVDSVSYRRKDSMDEADFLESAFLFTSTFTNSFHSTQAQSYSEQVAPNTEPRRTGPSERACASFPLDSEGNGVNVEVGRADDTEEARAVTTKGLVRKLSMGDGAPVVVQPLHASGDPTARVTKGLLSGLDEDQYGMPLAVFTKGYACLPYLSLQQHSLLSDVSLRGFVVGATNYLFRRQKHLTDVTVDIEKAHLEFQDAALERALSPTTADLRFLALLERQVRENGASGASDSDGGVSAEWEGSEEWVRAHFRLYLMSLLATTQLPDNEAMLADYGSEFVEAWQDTHNHRVWSSNKHPAMRDVQPGHPFQGHYTVADVKLRLTYSVQSSERGRRIGTAVLSTSRSVLQTGKAVGQSVVGGVLSGATNAMSSFFSYFSGRPNQPGNSAASWGGHTDEQESGASVYADPLFHEAIHLTSDP
uniref:Late secretory pathway protein AVL9 homolog n=2 Tax=Petromyzon marinus TaxID=7757 RepID=A0AAJ7SWX6_PETMA|nr:late secretory pathway protein AVL9 homolog [Petromyzon marinus]